MRARTALRRHAACWASKRWVLRQLRVEVLIEIKLFFSFARPSIPRVRFRNVERWDVAGTGPWTGDFISRHTSALFKRRDGSAFQFCCPFVVACLRSRSRRFFCCSFSAFCFPLEATIYSNPLSLSRRNENFALLNQTLTVKRRSRNCCWKESEHHSRSMSDTCTRSWNPKFCTTTSAWKSWTHCSVI